MDNGSRRRGAAGENGASVAATSAASQRGASALSLREILDGIDMRLAEPRSDAFRAVPTGFSPLDELIGEGLHRGEFMLVAGGQGIGKTTFTIQMARHVASRDDAVALYLCFEHDETQLLTKLLALESRQPELGGVGGLTVREIQQRFAIAKHRGTTSLAAVAATSEGLTNTLVRLKQYRDRLYLIPSAGRTMTVPALGKVVQQVRERSGKMVVVFVDYLQKVPAERQFPTEADRVAFVTAALKDLSLEQQVPIVAIAALDLDGLRAQRLHAHHLWGGSALAYEADVILMLAEKVDVIARVNFAFNPQKIQTFRDWVVVSITKNRFGQGLVDLEFQKDFAHGCFRPRGGIVAEKLIDELVYHE